MFKSQKCDVHAKSCVSTKMHTVVIHSKCCLLNRLTLPSFPPFPSPSPPPSSSPPGAVVWASTSFRRHTMRRKCRINDRLLLETMFDRQISQRIPSWCKLLVYCITHQRRARQRLVTFGKDELHLVKPACWWNRICGLGEGIVRRIHAAIKCLLQQPLNDVLFFWLSSWHERYRDTENPLCRTIACFETGYTQCQGSVKIEILFNLNDLFVTKGDDQERSDRYWEILKLFV